MGFKNDNSFRLFLADLSSKLALKNHRPPWPVEPKDAKNVKNQGCRYASWCGSSSGCRLKRFFFLAQARGFVTSSCGVIPADFDGHVPRG